MLIVGGGDAPRQDVLLGFKMLRGDLAACLPLALPRAGVTRCSVLVYTGCLSAIFNTSPLTLKKSPSLDDQ